MSKTTVTRLFIAANIAIVVGVILVLATVVTALAGGVVTIGGPGVVAIDGHTFAGAVGWLLLAAVILGGGTLIGIASWIGALFNTSDLEDKTWFGALLILGLLSFGWVAMVAYVVAGPDGTSTRNSDRLAMTA
ncbi:MAG TPA: hypothetical protein VFU17_14020 [Candidatus Limnocylindrales bacterium]|nr:hypothetical protein [Candidatus Limnocylindrales bacterium]